MLLCINTKIIVYTFIGTVQRAYLQTFTLVYGYCCSLFYTSDFYVNNFIVFIKNRIGTVNKTCVCVGGGWICRNCLSSMAPDAC